MVQGAVSFVDRNGPAHGYAVLDRAHLTRITIPASNRKSCSSSSGRPNC